MPKQAINYNNTHFYKLCCKDLDITDIYVGATTVLAEEKTNTKRGVVTKKPKTTIPTNIKL